MEREFHFLRLVRGSPRFPELIAEGSTDDFRYVILELLGPSLSAARRALYCQRYSKHTALIVAKEMLKRLEEFHGLGFVHRDVKPGNFWYRNDNQNPVSVIDFGL